MYSPCPVKTKVQVFDYTLHVCDGKTAELMSTRLLLRRSPTSCSILAALIKNHGILKISVEGLQKMLDFYKCHLRKNTTKSTKIRELMRLPEVQNCTTEQHRNKIEKLLTEMDAKRNKKHNAGCAEAANEEDADEARHCSM